MRKPFFVSALAASLGLILAGPLAAQTFKTLYNFTATSGPYRYSGTNTDGAFPVASLALSGNTLYGTAAGGGLSGNGTVFAVKTDGTGFTNLHSFAGTGDGASPYAGLNLMGNILFGTAFYGGELAGDGTVFSINSDGAGFTTLATVPGPQGSIVSGNTFYGTEGDGGYSGSGMLFKLNTDGTGFAHLYDFTATLGEFSTNSDGNGPIGPLVLSGDTLYGTGTGGGDWGHGTLFKVNTNGASFTVLHTFSPTSGLYLSGTNSDGAYPGPLVLSGNALYGAAGLGGSSSNGTVFAVNTDGTGFTVLHTFAATFGPNSTNNDGANPSPYVMVSGNTLYGTTLYGGSFSNGTVFALNTDGTSFRVLHTFTAYSGPNLTNSDGGYPYGGLIMSGNTLYGTAENGGSGGSGTVFSISLPPQLAITALGPNVILTWPTNVARLTLQSTPNLVSPVVWTPASPAPVVVNGLNTVTNPIIGDQQFYRLSQ